MTDSPTPAVTVGVDSYVSLDDANAVAANRLFAAEWGYADDDTRCRALRTATALLDRLRWQGRPVAAGQPLAWPRVPDKCPHGFPLQAPTPPEITLACAELAFHLLQVDTLSGAPVQMRQIGQSSEMYFATIADELPKHVRRLIEPHLRATSANVAEVAI